MRGKSWSVEEEKQLRKLIGEGLGVDRISRVMGKTCVSVMSKMYHLGLVLVDAGVAPTPPASSPASSSTPRQAESQALNNGSSIPSAVTLTSIVASAAAPFTNEVDAFATQIKADGPLPSIEEQLHVLNSAIVQLRKPGISRAEVARYSKIIDGVKVYNDLFAKFVDYRGLEIKVFGVGETACQRKKPVMFRVGGDLAPGKSSHTGKASTKRSEFSSKPPAQRLKQLRVTSLRFSGKSAVSYEKMAA